MGNTFFRFKQFTVHQQKSAMKVCTDSCLFGSLLPFDDGMLHVLDIGTGTGLLSLMYAQKNITAQIDAVEINTDAALEAKENFADSIFADRLHVFSADIIAFAKTINKKYNLIISNPPFYEGDLKSGNVSKDTAHHSEALNLQSLSVIISQLLTDKGTACMLLPYHRKEENKELFLQHELYCIKEISVKQTVNHQPFRVIQFFSAENTDLENTEVTIKDDNNQYTEEFVWLLKDYYLYLLLSEIKKD